MRPIWGCQRRAIHQLPCVCLNVRRSQLRSSRLSPPDDALTEPGCCCSGTAFRKNRSRTARQRRVLPSQSSGFRENGKEGAYRATAAPRYRRVSTTLTERMTMSETPDLPDCRQLMLPLLKIAAGGETNLRQAVERLSAELGLDAAQRAAMRPGGRHAIINPYDAGRPHRAAAAQAPSARPRAASRSSPTAPRASTISASQGGQATAGARERRKVRRRRVGA